MKLAKLLLIACLVCVCSVGFSAKFSETGGGISTVGTGGDYATLKEASRDFNYAPSWTSDWELRITSNLTESENVAFGRSGGTTYKLTIKLAPGVSNATIDFTQTADNPGWSGSLLIGTRYTTSTATADLFPMHNFTIDGYSADAPNNRGLTIQNATGTTGFPRPIRIFGDCDNVVIKNCIVKNRSTAAGGNDFTSRNDGTSNFIPDNGLIDNCTVECFGTVAAQGITSSASGTITTGNAQTGMTVQNSLIIARHRGIFLNQNAGGVIRNNIIRVNQTTSGYSSSGISHLASNATTGWTMEIYNNTLDQLATANFSTGQGMTAIEITGGPASPNVGTYRVYNNMICGFSYPSGTGVDQIYRAINSGSASVYFYIYNNSIFMPHFERVSGATVGRVGAILLASSTNNLTCDVKNNMICIKQTNGIGIWRNNSTGFTSNYNNLHAASGTIFGRLVGTNYGTLSAWQTGTGQDLNSYDKDPTVAQPPYSGKWASATNLHFDAQPGPIPGWATGIPITGITFDIDGDARGTNYPMKGCDDSPSLPVTLDMLVVE